MSPLRQTISCTSASIPGLKRFPDDGWFFADSNLIVNSLCKIAHGLKNYRFAGSYKLSCFHGEAIQLVAIVSSLPAAFRIMHIESFVRGAHSINLVRTA